MILSTLALIALIASVCTLTFSSLGNRTRGPYFDESSLANYQLNHAVVSMGTIASIHITAAVLLVPYASRTASVNLSVRTVSAIPITACVPLGYTAIGMCTDACLASHRCA